MSLRQLHGALVERLGTEVRGTSYGSVRSYWRGDTYNPRGEVVAAIAEILGMRPEYLLYGEPPKRPIDEQVPAPAPADPWLEWVQGFGWIGGLPEPVQVSFVAALRRYAAGCPEPLDDIQLRTVAACLGMFLKAPFELWGFDDTLSGRQLEDYARAVLGALMLAMPAPEQGDPVAWWGTAKAGWPVFQKGVPGGMNHYRRGSAPEALVRSPARDEKWRESWKAGWSRERPEPLDSTQPLNRSED